jgi:hypothetical protein
MKTPLLVSLLLLATTIAWSGEPTRENGLSLHMLPKRVASLSGQKWGLMSSPSHNQAASNKTFQSAAELLKYFKSLPRSVRENGIWIVTTHPDAYSDDEKQVLEDVKKACTQQNIPLFICRGSDLPDGWQRADKPSEK